MVRDAAPAIRENPSAREGIITDNFLFFMFVFFLNDVLFFVYLNHNE